MTGLHHVLDDAITRAGLVSCAAQARLEVTDPIAVSAIVRLDPAMPAGFPNARRPQDRAMDIILAVLLLDLTAEGQDAATLAGLPLNPAKNDVPFSPTFPYLAEPHG